MSRENYKVLLVDDEEKLLNGLRRRLSGDFDITTAMNGEDALSALKQDPAIAVIVADMQMPGMNGVELLRRAAVSWPQVRRLMLTGNADIETAEAAINSGKVMRFLRKPCDSETLKTAISQALEDYEFQTAGPAPTLSDGPAEQARTAFLSMMRHELKTPLAHIVGFATLLEQNRPEPDDPDAVAYLQTIRDSGKKMLSLIARIIEFSDLSSSGQRENSDASTDLVAIVADEVENIRPDASSKRVSVSIDSLRRSVPIRCNERDVRVAVRELLSNALKFNAAGGHIGVLIKCESDQAALRIVDSGCGVAADSLPRIRLAFQQADVGLARQYDGVGLGLALVDAVAALNGVHFNLVPGAGGGAIATLFFERASASRGADYAACV